MPHRAFFQEVNANCAVFLSKMGSKTLAAICILGIGISICAATGKAYAQTEDKLFATGLVFEDPDKVKEFPLSPKYRAFLPEKVDLSSRMPAVGNQGRQGSCVGWAVAYAARSYYSKASSGLDLGDKQNIASPAYLYDSIRRGTCERGSVISSALEYLKKGSLSIKEYPYDESKCRKPPQMSELELKKFKIKDWLLIDHKNLDQVRGALAQAHPVIIGAYLNDDYYRLRRGRVWTAGPPRAVEREGGHAFTIVGYDDRRKHFKFINSWGTDWGTRGYGVMDYDTFKNRVKHAFYIVPTQVPKKPHVKVVPPEPKLKPSPKDNVELPKFECSRLEMNEITSGKEITGFVGLEKDLETLQEKFKDIAMINVSLNPWPQCEALIIVDSQNQDRATKISLAETDLVEDDDLSFDVKTPDFSTHLHLAFFQADGSVVHLSQSALDNLVTLAPNSTVSFGDGKEGRQRFFVQEPFGNEMVLAITTRSPLFKIKRPEQETEREFLTALRRATIDMQKNDGVSRFYSADFAALKTRAKGE